MSTRLLLLVLASGLAVALTGTLGGCPAIPCDPNTCPDPNCPDPNCPDCNEPDPNAVAKTLHQRIFEDVLGKTAYEGTADSCLICHSDHARDILESAHWKWQGPVTNIAGLEGEIHGKRDLINNL